MFRDRKEAGMLLAAALQQVKGQNPLVLGIPRGGVEVGYYVAADLAAECSMLVVRKLPFPDNPEAGFGAIAEDGSVYLQPGARHWLPRETIDSIMRSQREEVKRRIRVLRQDKPLPDLRGRQVILVDDGIAMGSTVMAAVMCCRAGAAQRVIVASPVASRDARQRVAAAADEVVILLSPPGFQAVAHYYVNWYDVPDAEVIAFMQKACEWRLAS